MIPTSAAWAVAGQAMDGRWSDDEPHLSAATHFRVVQSPLLGLPLAPLSVRRVVLGVEAREVKGSSEAVWRDQHGNDLIVPFDLPEGTVATAHLPATAICCWASVSSSPMVVPPGSGHLVPGDLIPPGIPHAPRPRPATPDQPTLRDPRMDPSDDKRPALADLFGHDAVDDRLAALTRRLVRPGPVPSGGRPQVSDLVERPELVDPPDVVGDADPRPDGPGLVGTTLVVEGLVPTPRGDAVVARSSSEPHHVWASHLQRIRVTAPSGGLRVTGLRWIDAREVRGTEVFRDLDQPSPSRDRYVGFADFEDRAIARVRRGTPPHQPLWDQLEVAGPDAAATWGEADELQRIDDLAEARRAGLAALLDSTILPQQARVETHDAVDALTAPLDPVPTGVAVDADGRRILGTTTEPLLGTHLASLAEPGMARWAGFMDCDETHDVDPTNVIAYVVDGIWAPDLAAIEEAGLRATLGHAVVTRDQVLERVEFPDGSTPLPSIAELWPFAKEAVDLVNGPYLVTRVVLCATLGRNLDPPSPPVLDDPDDGRDDRPDAPVSRWVATEVPPAARREVDVGLGGLVPWSLLAGARRDVASGAVTSLHGRTPAEPGRERWTVPLVAGVRAEADAPHLGELLDRAAEAGEVGYRVAQSDWFGRWSAFARADLGAGLRPPPPRPTLRATHQQPTAAELAALVDGAPASGTLDLRVAVPAPTSLPPGAFALDHVELDVTHEASTTTTIVAVPAEPASGPWDAVARLAGPPLAPTLSTTVTVTARWVDTEGTASLDAEEVTLVLHDPRPPPVVALPATVAYTSRPDVTNRARARLVWEAQPGQHQFRVFQSDETALGAGLEELAADASASSAERAAAEAVLDDLATVATPEDRASVWETHAATLRRDWFTQVTTDPVVVGATTAVVFEHAVSGALRVLSLYRIVALSEAGAEGPFADAPVVPFAVPNSGPPTQPTLRVVPRTAPDGTGEAELLVTVPQGVTPAARWRLRRSSATSVLERMPIAAEGDVTTPTVDRAQALSIVDTGGAAHDAAMSLRDWTSWTWRVEVRGPDEPGGGPPGRWSRASAAVTAAIVPPDGPPAPTSVEVRSRAAGGVRIGVTVDHALRGGSVGQYTIDLYRALPGARLSFLASITADAPPSAGGRHPDRTGPFVIDDPEVGGDAPPGTPHPPGTMWSAVVVDPIGRTSPATSPVGLP